MSKEATDNNIAINYHVLLEYVKRKLKSLTRLIIMLLLLVFVISLALLARHLTTYFLVMSPQALLSFVGQDGPSYE